MDITSLVIIIIAAAVTAIIRFSPFLIFGKDNQLPGWIKYLGEMLPPAVMSVLLIYCLRNVNFTATSYGIPELVSVAAVILLHLWKRNTLLSIGVGTALYMLFVQVIFV